MEWFYEKEGNQNGPVSLEELVSLKTRGILSEATLVWKEGMPDWVPFVETEAARQNWVTCAVSGTMGPEDGMLNYGDRYCLPEYKEQFVQTLMEGGESQPEISQGIYRYRDPRTRAKWAMRTLLISSGMLVLFTVFDCIETLRYLKGGEEVDEASIMSLIYGAAALLYLAALIAGIVFFCRWFHLAAGNGHALDPQVMRFTPGWCVGYLFIPILTLFRPYQAMKDIWYASLPEGAPRSDRPGPPLVIAWWTLWIFVGFSDKLENIEFGFSVYLVAASVNLVVVVILTFLIIRIINFISENQVKKAEQF